MEVNTELEKNEAPRVGPEMEQLELGHKFYQLGKVHYDKSDLVKAEENFLSALNYLSSPRDASFHCKAVAYLIRIASERLESEKVEKFVAQTQKFMDKIKGSSSRLDSDYYYNRGIIKGHRGHLKQASKDFQTACKKAKEEDNEGLFAKSLVALAINSYQQEDYEKGLEYIGKLEKLLKVVKKLYLAGVTHFYAGKIYTKLKLYKKALHNFGLASKFFNYKKCWNLNGHLLLDRGRLYKEMGQYKKAMIFFELAHESIDPTVFKRLDKLIQQEMEDTTSASVDMYFDKNKRIIVERGQGNIDFKHRFVLFDILYLLAQNQGVSFSKEKLAKCIWKNEYDPFIHDKLIYTSFCRLRRIIESPLEGEQKQRGKYIVRDKHGYAFNPNAKIRFQSQEDSALGNLDISSPI